MIGQLREVPRSLFGNTVLRPEDTLEARTSCSRNSFLPEIDVESEAVHQRERRIG